ncbi:MAG: hypothetical protein M0C28_16565 [Candidatus Moduliflexus flocculans]|nr:hypothetical protein [Candidatus Moduliflexus flocculans]
MDEPARDGARHGGRRPSAQLRRRHRRPGDLDQHGHGHGRCRRRTARKIALKVYGASGWDRDAYLMPGVDLAFSDIRYPEDVGGRAEPPGAERPARLRARRHRRPPVPEPVPRDDRPEPRPSSASRSPEYAKRPGAAHRPGALSVPRRTAGRASRS